MPKPKKTARATFYTSPAFKIKLEEYVAALKKPNGKPQSMNGWLNAITKAEIKKANFKIK